MKKKIDVGRLGVEQRKIAVDRGDSVFDHGVILDVRVTRVGLTCVERLRGFEGVCSCAGGVTGIPGGAAWRAATACSSCGCYHV
jgi:hypothetical protein